MAPTPHISVRYALFSRQYIASGPDGHVDLVARGTIQEALKDGLKYFLDTREYDEDQGKWVLIHRKWE